MTQMINIRTCELATPEEVLDAKIDELKLVVERIEADLKRRGIEEDDTKEIDSYSYQLGRTTGLTKALIIATQTLDKIRRAKIALQNS